MYTKMGTKFSNSLSALTLPHEGTKKTLHIIRAVNKDLLKATVLHCSPQLSLGIKTKYPSTPTYFMDHNIQSNIDLISLSLKFSS